VHDVKPRDQRHLDRRWYLFNYYCFWYNYSDISISNISEVSWRVQNVHKILFPVQKFNTDRHVQFSANVPLIQLTWQPLVALMTSLLKTGIVLSWSSAIAVPQLKELQPSVILQQDGVLPHCSNRVRIPGTWIGPGGPISYAPLISLWNYAKLMFTEYLWMALKPFLQG